MKETRRHSSYTLYHPRWYRTKVSTYWWTRQWSHFRFILRELTSLGVAYTVLLLICFIRAVGQGAGELQRLGDWLASPLAILLNVIALFLLLFHAITWFNLAPRAMPVRIRGKRLPDWAIALPNYLLWVGASVVIAYVILWRN